MKQKWIALSLAALSLSVVPAGAATIRYTEEMKNATRRDVLFHDEVISAEQPKEPSQPQAAPEHTISYSLIENTVKSQNPTVKGFAKTLSSIYNTDVELQMGSQYISLQSQLAGYQQQLAQYEQSKILLETAIKNAGEYGEGKNSATAALQGMLASVQRDINVMKATVSATQMGFGALDDAVDDAKDDLEDTYIKTKKQLDNATNQLVMGAQSAYIGVITSNNGIATLDRNLAALDRNLAVLETQNKIGMASDIAVENLRQSKRSVDAQRETLLLMRENAQRQLALLLGEAADVEVHPTTTPSVSYQDLHTIDYEKDIVEARKNSYAIWAKQDAVEDASNDYEDAVTSSLDAYDAAKIDLEATKDSFTDTFYQLYQDVKDKERLLETAQTAYKNQQANYKVTELQYQRGMVSKLDYLTAGDTLAEAQDNVQTAELNLFTAFNTYDWARRGCISSLS